MTVDLRTPPQRASTTRPRGLRERIRERRRLAEQDRRNADLAQLHHIQGLVADAHVMVSTGWVQHGWFSYRDEQGAQQVVSARNLGQLTGRPVTGACLVGAIVHAGGGPAAVHTQPVQRALDLTWHTLSGGQQPLRWCPAPPERAAHVRDLTWWNDDPDRTRRDVLTLLDATGRAATAQIEQARTR
jgi:hypothetical protein